MPPRGKPISHSRLVSIARQLLSTSASKRSSTGTLTATSPAWRSSEPRASEYGSSIKRGFHRGIYTSEKTGRREYFDSSYELRRFRALDAHPLVQDWGRPKLKIRYKLGKHKHNDHPDILVQYHDGRIFLEEVKGWIPNKRQFIKKKHMAVWYCEAKGWTYRVVFRDDLETLF